MENTTTSLPITEKNVFDILTETQKLTLSEYTYLFIKTKEGRDQFEASDSLIEMFKILMLISYNKGLKDGKDNQ